MSIRSTPFFGGGNNAHMAPEGQQYGANRARSRLIAGFDEHLIALPSGADAASRRIDDATPPPNLSPREIRELYGLAPAPRNLLARTLETARIPWLIRLEIT
jgi:hypothetical protein